MASGPGGRGYSGYGRGGRGAALLQALQQPVRRPGEDQSKSDEEKPQVQVASRPPMMGRGAQLASLLAQQKNVGSSSTDAAPTKEKVEIPLGRGVTIAPQQQTDQPLLGRGRGSLLQAMGRGLTMPAPSKSDIPAGGPGAKPKSPPQVASPIPKSPPRAVAERTAATSSAPPEDPRGGGDGGEKRLSRLEYMLSKMEMQAPAVEKRGKQGQPVRLAANYIRLKSRTKGVFQYAVSYTPVIDSVGMRFRLLYEHSDVLGETKVFDGAILFLPIQLPSSETVFKGRRPTDGTEVNVRVKLVKILPHSGCVQLFNVLFRKIMGILKMCPVGRHYYDPFRPAQVPQHKLEVWPGYITAIQDYEGGLMILTDVSHRVLRLETVLEIMESIAARDKSSFEREFAKAIIGVTVLTRYNNKTYRIDDIAWDKNPESTFDTTRGGQKSFVQYYAEAYNKQIRNLKQPLLIHRPKKREQRQGRGQLEVICLIPELCHMTGLTDDMRNDFRVMKDLSAHTRVTPAQRQIALRKFCDSIHSNPEANQMLSNWGLDLDDDTVHLEGRYLPSEDIIFKDYTARGTEQADWGRDIGRHSVITPVDLNNWIIIFTRRDAPRVNDFIQNVMRVSPDMGLKVRAPMRIELPNDKTESYLRSIKENMSQQVQMVCTIFPTSRDDRYNAIKKLCCVDCPVPSQVIISKTIGDQKKLRSVTQKVMLQINAKLGGELWSVKIPTKSLMVIGIDVYHDNTRGKLSIAGFVASLNTRCTRWYSRVCFQLPNQELIDGLKKCMIDALEKFHEVNHALPDKIIVFRDGVGDGQLTTVGSYEVPQLITCFKMFGNYDPGISVIVVQKRINTRIFAELSGRGRGQLDNPKPGTVMDHTITRKEWYDFFLVSQHVRQGTVSPTHYVIVYDSLEWPTDRMQQISYKLTHLYYNWPGTVRVPAPCQYAHKLAYLVGQNIHKEPSPHLADRLFFL